MFLEQVVQSHHHVGHRTEGTVLTYLTSQTLWNKEYHPYDTHCNIYSSWTLAGMLRECRSKKWQNIFRSNVPTSLQHASLLLSSVSNTTSFVHSCNTTNQTPLCEAVSECELAQTYSAPTNERPRKICGPVQQTVPTIHTHRHCFLTHSAICILINFQKQAMDSKKSIIFT
jgi:hypothetical protein